MSVDGDAVNLEWIKHNAKTRSDQHARSWVRIEQK